MRPPHEPPSPRSRQTDDHPDSSTTTPPVPTGGVPPYLQVVASERDAVVLIERGGLHWVNGTAPKEETIPVVLTENFYQQI